MKALTTIITFFFFFSTADAFILVGENVKFSDPEKVKINVSSTSCATAGTDADALFVYIEDAIDDYWNRVSSSALEIEKGSVVDVDIDTQNPEANTILVGCSTNTNFSASASYPEGVANMGGTPGAYFGRVYINNLFPNGWSAAGNERLLYVMLHEIGHAIGLHHSNDPASVMTYSTQSNWGTLPTDLAQDDRDGVTYLYPNEKKAGGLVGSCGSIDIDGNGPGGGPLSFTLGALLVALFAGVARPARRAEARSKSSS